MAAVSATSARLGSSLKPASLSSQVASFVLTTQIFYKKVASRFAVQHAKAFSTQSVSFSTTKVNLRSLRSSRFRVVCAAKPETVSKVLDIVKKQLALTEETALTPESTFSALGADSLDTVEIVMKLEENFDISIEDDNSQNITTVQDAADLIEKLVEKKSEAA